METIDYVKKYQKDLADNKNGGVFNFWAFLFSSLYFLYTRMYLYCFVFLIIPTVICGIFQYGKISFLVILISHIIAGFVANPSYRKYKEKYVETHKDVDRSRNVDYDSMSVAKIVICMILSMGFYSLYWFYRHWNKYKQTTHDDVYPFANAWFNIFTAPSLFSKIDNSIKTGKNLRSIGIAYFICSLAAFVSIRIMENAVSEIDILVSFLAWVALFLVQPAALVFVQNEINKYNEKNNQVSKVEILNIKEAAITILGLVIVLLQIGATKNEEQYLKNYDGYLSEYTVEQQSKIGASIGFIYRHTQGYGDFCKDEGYVLSKYPNDFSQYFSQDINDLEHSLSQYGYSLKDVTDQFMSEEFRANVKSSIYEEFYNLKKFLIMLQVAENSNLPVEQIQWDESWNNLITMNDICKIFDENGLDLLKEGENKNFLKQNKI